MAFSMPAHSHAVCSGKVEVLMLNWTQAGLTACFASYQPAAGNQLFPSDVNCGQVDWGICSHYGQLLAGRHYQIAADNLSVKCVSTLPV